MPELAGPALSVAQSVLDLVEIDLRFTLRGFAEGDDTDFMLGLGMNDGYRSSSKQVKGYEPVARRKRTGRPRT